MDEPVRTAVALAYAAGDGAPRVVAKGGHETAEAIVRAARDAGVPLHADEGLARLLMGVPLDERIPPTLYVAVAEVLAWLQRAQAAAGVPK